jgi:hypothetical protein
VKVPAALFIILLLAACATTPAPREPERLFNDHLFDPPSVNVNAADVFAVSAEMRQYLETESQVSCAGPAGSEGWSKPSTTAPTSSSNTTVR